MSRPASRLATAEDLARLPDKPACEVIAGEIVEKASPGPDHGTAQARLAGELGRPFNRRGGGGGQPGGWWLMVEVEIELETHEVYRPDLSGWRRDRVPERPRVRPVRIRPDWVCEILSPSNARYDLIAKLRTYHRCGVQHYWIVDPSNETLTVHRWGPDGYVVALTAARGDKARAEPFDAIELQVGLLFGDEPEE